MSFFTHAGKFTIEPIIKALDLVPATKEQVSRIRKASNDNTLDRKIFAEIIVYWENLGEIFAYVQVYKIGNARTYFVQINDKQTKHSDYGRKWFVTKVSLRGIKLYLASISGKKDVARGKEVKISVTRKTRLED